MKASRMCVCVCVCVCIEREAKVNDPINVCMYVCMNKTCRVVRMNDGSNERNENI